MLMNLLWYYCMARASKKLFYKYVPCSYPIDPTELSNFQRNIQCIGTFICMVHGT